MWIIAERILLVLAIVVGVTQVLLPIMMDKPLFWLFRKKEKFLKEDPKKDFDETVEYLKSEKEKTAKAEAELNAEIEEKVGKVIELKKASEGKPKDPQ